MYDNIYDNLLVDQLINDHDYSLMEFYLAKNDEILNDPSLDPAEFQKISYLIDETIRIAISAEDIEVLNYLYDIFPNVLTPVAIGKIYNEYYKLLPPHFKANNTIPENVKISHFQDNTGGQLSPFPTYDDYINSDPGLSMLAEYLIHLIQFHPNDEHFEENTAFFADMDMFIRYAVYFNKKWYINYFKNNYPFEFNNFVDTINKYSRTLRSYT